MMAALLGNFLRFILTILTESPFNCHFYSAVSHLILQFTTKNQFFVKKMRKIMKYPLSVKLEKW